MKKLLLFVSLLALSVAAFSQGLPYPNYQPQGSPQTRWSQQGAVQGIKGIINGVYPDTATANIGYIDFYPGAQIFTTNDRVIWVRDFPAYRWIRQVPDIVSFTFNTDSSITICFGSGVCNTVAVNNFTTVVNNVVQNFIDSSIIKINDTTLLVCTGNNVCDTVHLGNSNTYNVFFDSTTNQFFIVTCDTVQIVCPSGPESCVQQQVCDTILIPKPAGLVFQNLIWKNGPVVEVGDPIFGVQAQMIHDTYFNTGGYQLQVRGATAGRPPFSIYQGQWSQLSPSMMSLQHFGKYPPTELLDGNNPVKLYFNYTDPFMVPATGGLAGDTIGYLGQGEYGYLLMTNAQGRQANFLVDDYNAKQVGMAMYTYGASTKGIGMFVNKLPSAYNYGNNPAADSTLDDAMVLMLKTTGQVQLPQYTTGAFPITSPLYIIAQDAQGNLFQFPPGGLGGGGGLLLSADNGLSLSPTATNVQLGSPSIAGAPLLHETWVGDASAFSINFNSGVTGNNATIEVNNASSGGAIFGQVSTATAVVGNATSNGNGGAFISVNGLGLSAISGTNLAAIFNGGGGASNGESSIIQIQRSTGGVAGNGIGQRLEFVTQTSDGVLWQSNMFHSIWTIANTLTRTSKFIIDGVNNAITADLFTLQGNGETRLNKYGVGSFTAGTATYLSAYKADGTLMEYPAGGLPGGGALITADQGVKANTATNVRLGGDNNSEVPFSSDRYINTVGQTLIVSTLTSGANPLRVTSTDANAINAIATTGYAVEGQADIAGIHGQGNSGGMGVYSSTQNSSTNTILENMRLTRYSSGTAANGIGESLTFEVQTATNIDYTNKLISQWTDVTHATRKSQLDITGVYNGTTNTIASFYGSGVVGIGVSSGYSASRLQVQDATNGVTSNQMAAFSLTSTGAASNTQMAVSIGTAGTNSNSSQRTRGLNVTNTHAGTGSVNIGGQFSATGGASNYAILVPADEGFVGIGVDPITQFHVERTLTVSDANDANILNRNIIRATANGTSLTATNGRSVYSNYNVNLTSITADQTVPLSVQWGGTKNILSFFSNTNSDFTVSQSGSIRSPAATFSEITLTTSINSGTTISHLANMCLLPIFAQDGVNEAGTITNYYGLLLNDQTTQWIPTTSMTITNQWGIYQEGPNDRNYFAAKSGFGTSTPTMAVQVVGGRLGLYQGADVASAAGAIAVGNDGNTFELTGTASVTLISNVNWQNGSEITFYFTSTATLVDGTANSGTDIGMELNANTNFVGSAGASITLRLVEIGGTQRWREKCRSVN